MTHSIPPGLDGSVWEKCHTHDLQMRHTTLLVAGMSAGRRRPRAPGVSGERATIFKAVATVIPVALGAPQKLGICGIDTMWLNSCDVGVGAT
jgi:hypothetical protein